MSITKDQAKTASDTAKAGLQAASDQNFIDAADLQISEATAQGVYQVNCTVFDTEIDPKAIFEYYSALGYHIYFPDFPQNQFLQPAELFGIFWINYWMNDLIPRLNKFPMRIVISWQP